MKRAPKARLVARTNGFALVIALSLMAFVLLLLLSISTLVQVEQKSAAISKSRLIARENAKLGAMIALGQLQKYTGPDQAATAPATIFYADEDETMTWSGQKSALKQWSVAAASSHSSPYGVTRMTSSERDAFVQSFTAFWEDKQPHWVGVWEGQSRGVDGDYNREQQPLWLVSGYGLDATTSISPIDPIGADYVTLVGTGSAMDVTETGYTRDPDELNGLVQAPKVRIEPTQGEPGGAYAFYVSDESQKVNVGLVDAYAGSDLNDETYNYRLYSPQRSGLEAIRGLNDLYSTNPWDVHHPRLGDMISAGDLRLLEPSVTQEMLRKAYHTITSNSNGLFTDSARGGLRKDLSHYLQTGGSLSDLAPIVDPALYQSDSRIGTSNGGFPSSVNNIPTWGDLKAWANNTSANGSDAIPVSKEAAPILMHSRLFFGFSYQGSSVYLHYLPILILWNPYDVPLASASYEVTMDMWFKMNNVKIATQTSLVDATVVDGYRIHQLGNSATMHDGDFSGVASTDPNPSPPYKYSPYSVDTDLKFSFSSDFQAGEILVFTPNSDIELEAGTGGSAVPSLTIPMSNGFISSGPSHVRQQIFEILDPVPGGTNIRMYQDYDSGAVNASQDGYKVAVSMTANGETIVDRSIYGSNVPWTIANTLHHSKPLDVPSSWRPLYSSSEYDDQLDTTSNLSSSDPGSPISLISHFALQPFTGNNLDGRFHAHNSAFLGTKYRAFANMNLSAEKLTVNPLVELERGLAASYNDDGFIKFSMFQSFAPSGSGPYDGRHLLPWDDNIADVFGGRFLGFSLVSNTLDPDNKFAERSQMPLRAVLRSDVDLLSLGQFSQANLTELSWQPSFAIGNSEASPYVGRQYISGLRHSVDYGSSSGVVSNDSENQMLDMSYLLNDALWDQYFLSSIPATGSSVNLNDVIAGEAALPNARYHVRSDVTPTVSDLRNLDNPAYYLRNLGAFNVNSTSVDAWRALLTAFRGLQIEDGNGEENPEGTLPIARSTDPLGGKVVFTNSDVGAASFGAVPTDKDYYNVLGGFRYLDDEMIQSLAERIVDEVKFRGPFYSLSDFVNRRLVAPNNDGDSWVAARSQDSSVSGWLTGSISTDYDATEGLTGINGALQRAINLSGINGGDNYPESLKADAAYNNDWVYRPRDNFGDYVGQASFYAQARWYLDTEHLAGSPAGESGYLLSHSPGFVTQADVLSMIAPALTTRGDTFKIRSYGEVDNPVTGRGDAKIWLEMIVQRIPDPITDTDGDYEPDDAMGRQYKIISMRWLNEDEV
jgi:hypothetical protein